MPFSPEALLSHTDFVRGLARSLLRDPAAADDVAQRTLLRALERPPRSATGLRSWLYVVTRNFARQDARGTLRRRGHEARAARTAEERLPSAADVLEREAMRSEVVQAVLSLPETQRTVVLLRFYEGRAPREIARRLELPVETVRSRLKRGLAALRTSLDRRRSRAEWMGALAPLAGPGVWSVAAATKTAAAIGAVVLAGAVWWTARSPVSPPPNTGPLADASPTAPVLAEPGDERPAAPQDGAAREVVHPAAAGRTNVVLGGLARDPGGAALAGERVYLSASGPLPTVGLGRLKVALVQEERQELRLTETDADGSFRFELEEPGRFHVGLVHPADPALHAGDGRWVEAPATGVLLTAVPAPVATLAVRALLVDTGEELVGFRASIQGETTRTYSVAATETNLLEVELALPQGKSYEAFDVAIEHPDLGTAEERVELRAGERFELLLHFTGNQVVRGTVVDELDQPVGGALVFFGIQELLRGDEPFKPYDASRVQNGVRTDEHGGFELAGKGRWISAWHAELSPTTVAVASAERIVLAPRSTLHGVLLAADGSPVVAAKLTLDRVREAVTDDEGRFLFEGLEAGIRGLRLDSGRMFAVDVPAAETVEVELTAGLPRVTVELQQEDLPYGLNPKDYGVLVGEGRVFSVQDQPVVQGRIELENVLPGEYWLMTAAGLIARARIDAPHVAADIGTSTLTVYAAPGRQLFLAPAAGNELVRLMANRVAQRRVPASGEVSVSPLPAGTYIVGAEGEGELGRVHVTGAQAVLDLR